MDKVEIINYVVEKIKKQGRATVPNYMDGGPKKFCRYLTEDNKRCAVGLCVADQYIDSVNEHEGNVRGIYTVSKLSSLKLSRRYIDPIFEPKFKGHNIRFWRDLQSLHDISTNWEVDYSDMNDYVITLTQMGLYKCDDIRYKIENELY